MISLKSFKPLEDGEHVSLAASTLQNNTHQASFKFNNNNNDKQQDLHRAADYHEHRQGKKFHQNHQKINSKSTLNSLATSIDEQSTGSSVMDAMDTSRQVTNRSPDSGLQSSEQDKDSRGSRDSPPPPLLPVTSSSAVSIVVVNKGNIMSTSGERSLTMNNNQVAPTTQFSANLMQHNNENLGKSISQKPLMIQGFGNNNENNNNINNDSDAKMPGKHFSSRALSNTGHFEIIWSNLSYKIEPKWYKKFTFVDTFFSYIMPGQTMDNHSSASSTASSSAGMNDNQHQMHSSAQADNQLQQQLNLHQQSSKLNQIQIFKNLNGTIKSGQMTAILGPSGAGKTTLLNCLTGKLKNGVSGCIKLVGSDAKRLKMCTIPQKDHLLELLTVEENLWFASKIKNPEYGFDHVKNIERVIDLLGLKRCRTAKIKKISGGQHKRVSIAQELLTNPDILVLDEPTSGLDSLTCFKTISMLRDLVELSASNEFIKPMAIIVTIHQPQPKVFNLFHHVYVLANGGRAIFEGSPQASMDIVSTVTEIRVEDNVNSRLFSGSIDPASFLIEIASEEYGLEPIKALSEHQYKSFWDKYKQDNDYYNNQNQFQKRLNHHGTDRHSNLVEIQFGAKVNLGFEDTNNDKHGKRNKNHNKQLSDTNNDLYMSEQLKYTQERDHSGRFWCHVNSLAYRTFLTTRRDPLLMTSRVLFHIMIPILMAYVYGQDTGKANACPNYESEIDITQVPTYVEGKKIEYMLEELHMSIENVSMFFIIMYAFSAAVLALNALSFPLNMQVLLKETRNGWYSLSSFVLAKTIADLPLELTMPSLTMALTYSLTGQPSSYLHWRMFTICLIMTLCSLIAQTQALILGALVMSSVQTAVFVSQASQLPWVILAGFTIRIKRLSEPLKFISLTSFYRLGCEAITLTRYGFGICECDPEEITGGPVKLVGIPDQLRNLAQFWLDSVNNNNEDENKASFNGTELSTTTLPSTQTTTPKTDIFQHLANQLSYANSYGVNITSCDDVTPDRIRAINLNDSWLVARIWHLFIMLLIMKFLLYYAVRFSIGIRL